MIELIKGIYEVLGDIKAKDIRAFDTRTLTDQYDQIVLATATSTQHAKSIANHLHRKINKNGQKNLGIQGIPPAEWVLVDYGNIVIHIMLEETRRYYRLEELWGSVPIHMHQQNNSDSKKIQDHAIC